MSTTTVTDPVILGGKKHHGWDCEVDVMRDSAAAMKRKNRKLKMMNRVNSGGKKHNCKNDGIECECIVRSGGQKSKNECTGGIGRKLENECEALKMLIGEMGIKKEVGSNKGAKKSLQKKNSGGRPEKQIPTTSFYAEVNKKYQSEFTFLGFDKTKGCSKTHDIEFFSYQKFVREYMKDDPSNARGLLVFHGLGSGKTITSILVAEEMKDRKKVVLMPARLKSEYKKELRRLGHDDAYIDANYKFLSYNSQNVVRDILYQGLDDKLLIIDEVHTLLNTMISPAATQGAQVYEHIMDARNLKMLCLSGTPAVSDPFELAVLFNMLKGWLVTEKRMPGGRTTTERHNLFPTDYKEYSSLFVSEDRSKIINGKIFEDRIAGLVSFYGGIYDPEGYIVPHVSPLQIIEVEMSATQWEQYMDVRREEIELERLDKFKTTAFTLQELKKPQRKSATTYKRGSLQSCNFATPNKKLIAKFKGKKTGEIKKIRQEVIKSLSDSDLKEPGLAEFSPKAVEILHLIEQKHANQPVFIYSSLDIFGVSIIARILEANGYKNFAEHGAGKKTFAIISGDTTEKEKSLILESCNTPANIDGSHVQVLLGTKVISEGVTLKNFRAVVIMEGQWRKNRIDQVIGRAVRTCSHQDLPIEQRHVDVYILLSREPRGVQIDKLLQGDIETVDFMLYNKALRDDKLIGAFFKHIRNAAVDCQLNISSNSKLFPVKCRSCSGSPANIPLFPVNIKEHVYNGTSCFEKLELTKKNNKYYDSRGIEYAQDENGDWRKVKK